MEKFSRRKGGDVGSSPALATKLSGISSTGRAADCRSAGYEFEPRMSRQTMKKYQNTLILKN